MGAIGDLSLFKADRCEAVFLYPHALQAGIDRAKAKGTRFGRKPVLDAGKRKVLAERNAAGETMAKLALEYECGEATIWRALQG
jgi:hypothetical protein